ncbi:ribosomal protection-like ABC-F family protein [Lysinibacillus sp. 3P01SB]|uniref:ribosomal protection-like ABC-F family protein n=1 Tax=Lysinibacillus sp. 3P01SB TaxID=3132284 RepID=UPI0039A46465
MKELLRIEHLTLEAGERLLFKEADLTVKEREIIGVIGRNGAGKSLLLAAIKGELKEAENQLNWRENVSIQMVEQEREAYKGNYLPLMRDWHIPELPYELLSGGQQLKWRLAEGFSKKAELLLLDEPTNHLDESSVAHLIKEMKSYEGTMIVVSHDRHFLDEVATKIWSIEEQGIAEQEGNYSHYINVRDERKKAQQAAYEKQQKKVEQIEKQIGELTSWSQKAHRESTKQEGFKEYHRVKAKRTDAQIKSKRKLLEKQLQKEKVGEVKQEQEVFFDFQGKKKQGRRLFELKNAKVAFNEKILFRSLYLTVQKGERIAISGDNGSGKTTLLKLLTGEIEPTGGTVWRSPTATIGYLSQQVFDLPLHSTPAQLFERETFEERSKVQTVMSQLGFSHLQWEEPIENMSMGERVKCKLMQYILNETDVLLLDEPTNHLDLPSREQLERTLVHYPCTLIVVSHDRYFRQKVTKAEIKLSEPERKVPQKGIDEKEELRMKLENERQHVLGKLSILTNKDEEYAELDAKFLKLTKRINALK